MARWDVNRLAQIRWVGLMSSDRETEHEASCNTRGGGASARAVLHLGEPERAMSWHANAPRRGKRKEGKPAGDIKAERARVGIAAEAQCPRVP